MEFYETAFLVRYADGETEWMSDMEWARFSPVEGASLIAVSVAVDVPEGEALTDEWREATAGELRTHYPRFSGWETLDESDDTRVSEYVIDLADEGRAS
jgi:hypothetical protein